MSNDHQVPQFYLRKFASKRTKKSKTKIYVFDKSVTSAPYIEEKLIKDVACKGDLYTAWLDEIITAKEDKWSCTLDCVLEELNKGLRIDDSLKSEFAEIIAYQFLRTEKLLDSFIALSKDKPITDPVVREGIEERYGLPCDEAIGKETWYKSFIDPDLSTIKIFVDYFMSYFEWGFGVNISSVRLITSDMPVVHTVIGKEKYTGQLRLADFGKTLYYPLSPEILLTLTDKKALNFQINDKYAYLKMTKQHVKHVNNFQIAQCRKFVYASRLDELRKAKGFVRNHPECKQIDPKLI